MGAHAYKHTQTHTRAHTDTQRHALSLVHVWRSEGGLWDIISFHRAGPRDGTLAPLRSEPLCPRQTRGLPARASSLTLAECLQCFVGAIFYVGKGTRARPDAHLWEALGYRERPGKKVGTKGGAGQLCLRKPGQRASGPASASTPQACPKVRRILDIWASGRGVISLHCFQHAVAVEAFTREACLLDALGRVPGKEFG